MSNEIYFQEILPNFVEDDVLITKDAVRHEIRRLLAEGVFHQDELFEMLYPVYQGHYSVLREVIAEEKNYA